MEEFLRLFYELAADEEKRYAKRAKEVEDEIKTFKQKDYSECCPFTIFSKRLWELDTAEAEPILYNPFRLRRLI